MFIKTKEFDLTIIRKESLNSDGQQFNQYQQKRKSSCVYLLIRTSSCVYLLIRARSCVYLLIRASSCVYLLIKQDHVYIY